MLDLLDYTLSPAFESPTPGLAFANLLSKVAGNLDLPPGNLALAADNLDQVAGAIDLPTG